MQKIAVTRTRHRILPDPRRVLAKPFLPGEEMLLPGQSRGRLLMERLLAIPEQEVGALLQEVLANFAERHRDFDAILGRHFDVVARYIPAGNAISPARRSLVGAYFTHEYSVEAAALFNPSIVIAPDQSGLKEAERRFVMSLRAVGEGHLSSIEFRTGVISLSGDISFDPPGPFLVGTQRTAPVRYEKHLFRLKLMELQAWNDIADRVLSRLAQEFALEELEASLQDLEQNGPPPAIWFETAKVIRVLAASNYVATFPESSSLSERVLFPAGPNETRGMEDARFVQFTDGATTRYYATYTAYDGFNIMPQLIATEDFRTFKIATLNGLAAQNKGMALFPRKIGGMFVMLSRKDRENLHLATSDNVRFWNDVTELWRPSRPWELMQIGNCGSPLETSEGWLVLTHGVGPMRRYGLGAILLDLDDPRKVIGALKEPLMLPDATEREGYVPNVLYTCGGLINGDELILPYGFSDAGIGVARIGLADLLRELTKN